MIRSLLFVFTILALLAPSDGCINHHLRNEGAIQEGKDAYTRITTPSESLSWERVRSELEEKLKSTRDVETLNDLAVAMIHTGATEGAIPLLEEIERTTPGLYQTATNLGTAYELLGRPKDALTWIERGITINPYSHEGSEWIHVAVLKAKLALEKDPHWLEKNRVLGMNFGNGSFPKVPNVLPTGTRGEPLNATQVLDALELQLRERLQFVAPPDEIVAQLLFDYASLSVIKTKAMEAGLPVFRFSRNFATTAVSRKAIDKRLQNEPATFWEKRIEWGFSLTFLCLVLLGSFRNVRRAVRRQQPGALDERYISFPPLLTILMGLIALMWIAFSKTMDWSLPAFTLSMAGLAAVCFGLFVLVQKGERQRRHAGAENGFSFQSFSISTALFVAAWISVSYLSIMKP